MAEEDGGLLIAGGPGDLLDQVGYVGEHGRACAAGQRADDVDVERAAAGAALDGPHGVLQLAGDKADVAEQGETAELAVAPRALVQIPHLVGDVGRVDVIFGLEPRAHVAIGHVAPQAGVALSLDLLGLDALAQRLGVAGQGDVFAHVELHRAGGVLAGALLAPTAGAILNILLGVEHQ